MKISSIARCALAALSLYACAASAQEAPAEAPEQVVVTGQRPGPGLWKVSRDGHVLWVFGSYSPLPAGMDWRSHEVEAILAQSQEYIHSPGARADFSFFRSVTLLPRLIGIRKNPDGKELRDVLPSDVYERWLAAKAKYIGDDGSIERERPMFVADTLFRKGLAKSGLGDGRQVRSTIDGLLKKYKIKTTLAEVKLELDDPGKALSNFKQSQLDDVACFTKTLDGLEGDIDAMRQRANAWAIGDIEVIEKMDFAGRDKSCQDAVFNSTFMKSQPGLQSLDIRMRDAWIAAAEKALAANASTFSTLPLKDILGDRSYLALLAEKGYTVEKPE
ncbi:TraB/GumN family protein [Massilia endophytica]|uniref:TraB/GumN family protein n=1 Tax=Massilia endophytica TaxID=2899220 RepID=UPI001E298387|nr:TraB/GumN family protein [Massilia endophytica]UGQ45935.1 TraB/GumN family protein [Massilia endophytica]